MRNSYRTVIVSFFILYLIPIAVLWYFVNDRIEARAIALQLFLKNQIDIDRQILSLRDDLRQIQPNVRSVLLKKSARTIIGESIGIVKEYQAKNQKFWRKYESTYIGSQRSTLMRVLEETQEMNLAEEESETIRQIQKKIDIYITDILTRLEEDRTDITYSSDSQVEFLESLDAKRDEVYKELNELIDIRYIYAQRMVFSASGENERQSGFLTSIFVILLAAIFSVSLVEYFTIHRPFGDIMKFLQDLHEGKKGQRLYFSSFIREIKKSEEIINDVVAKAEESEGEAK